MGSVRIYKEYHAETLGINPWQVRSNGCTRVDASYCSYGLAHGGVCDGYGSFVYLLKNLNDPTTVLGAYLKK